MIPPELITDYALAISPQPKMTLLEFVAGYMLIVSSIDRSIELLDKLREGSAE